MNEPTGRTMICSVVFIDIVRYSEVTVSRQMTLKARLNEAIAAAVADVAEKDRVILDTGDGAAICYFGDPEDALFAATAINETLRQAGPDAPVLRTGVNLGPIKMVVDLNGRTNVVGDGINVAQRVMSFADEGEILVSRSFFEVVVRLTEGNERLFRYMGTKRDKHIREHQIYAFSVQEREVDPAATDAVASDELADVVTFGADPEPLPDDATVADPPVVAPDLVAAEARRLATYIGPLATVVARRAAEQAASLPAFYDALAAVIQDEGDRTSFLAGASERPDPPEAPPASVVEPSSPVPAAGVALDDAELATIERRLAEHIGPLAGILVRRAARATTDRDALCRQLATHIESESGRAAFLAALRTGT